MFGFGPGILKTRITVLRVHFYGSLRFTAIVLTAVNFWDSNPNGTLRVPVQLYRTTRIVRLRCAALSATPLVCPRGVASAYKSIDLYRSDAKNLMSQSTQLPVVYICSKELVKVKLYVPSSTIL